VHLIAEEDATGLVRGVVHPGVAREVDHSPPVGKRKGERDQEELEGVAVVYNDGTHSTKVAGHTEVHAEIYICQGRDWHCRPVHNLQFRASHTFSCICKDTKIFPRTSLLPIVLKIFEVDSDPAPILRQLSRNS
jgi:hypothetical protein